MYSYTASIYLSPLRCLQGFRRGLRRSSLPTRLAFLAFGLLVAALIRYAELRQPRSLFAYPLTTCQCREVTEMLEQMEVDYAVQDGQVFVAGNQFETLAKKLANTQTPHPDTASQRTGLYDLDRQLEPSWSRGTFREMPGITEGRFKFSESQIQINLVTSSGQRLTASQAGYVTRLYEDALKPGTVTVFDQFGRVEPQASQTLESLPPALQATWSEYLNEHAQKLVDQVFGRGMITIEVQPEIDCHALEIDRIDSTFGTSPLLAVEKRDDQGGPVQIICTVGTSDYSCAHMLCAPPIRKLTCKVSPHGGLQSEEIRSKLWFVLGLEACRGDVLLVNASWDHPPHGFWHSQPCWWMLGLAGWALLALVPLSRSCRRELE